VVRRINTDVTTAGTVVALTDGLALERDGTSGGFRVTSNNSNSQMIASLGMTQDGAAVNRYLAFSSPGTSTLYSDADNVVYFQCTFGNPSAMDHQTQVCLARQPDSNTWTGTVISTYNQ
jgi:hypothetical protein